MAAGRYNIISANPWGPKPPDHVSTTDDEASGMGVTTDKEALDQHINESPKPAAVVSTDDNSVATHNETSKQHGNESSDTLPEEHSADRADLKPSHDPHHTEAETKGVEATSEVGRPEHGLDSLAENDHPPEALPPDGNATVPHLYPQFDESLHTDKPSVDEDSEAEELPLNHLLEEDEQPLTYLLPEDEEERPLHTLRRTSLSSSDDDVPLAYAPRPASHDTYGAPYPDFSDQGSYTSGTTIDASLRHAIDQVLQMRLRPYISHIQRLEAQIMDMAAELAHVQNHLSAQAPQVMLGPGRFLPPQEDPAELLARRMDRVIKEVGQQNPGAVQRKAELSSSGLLKDMPVRITYLSSEEAQKTREIGPVSYDLATERVMCDKCVGKGWMHDFATNIKHKGPATMRCKKGCHDCVECGGSGMLDDKYTCIDCFAHGYIHPVSAPHPHPGDLAVACPDCETCATCSGRGITSTPPRAQDISSTAKRRTVLMENKRRTMMIGSSVGTASLLSSLGTESSGGQCEEDLRKVSGSSEEVRPKSTVEEDDDDEDRPLQPASPIGVSDAKSASKE
ncbi:hypothetical protein HKX48_005128 [Thoreauomyces humboldtii]|nr:hypothetical protein HKX48_005128 [Thoreauomyces humboldtii]